MNIEELKSKVRFKEYPADDYGRVRLSAALVVSSSLEMDPNHSGQEKLREYVKERLIEGLFKLLYEDQRRELILATEEFLLACPFNYEAMDKARRRLIAAAKYQGP